MLRTCSEKAFWSRTGPHAYTTTRPPSSSQLLEARTQCQRHGRRLRGYQPLWSARARRVQPSAAPQTTWWRTPTPELLPTRLRRRVGPFRGYCRAATNERRTQNVNRCTCAPCSLPPLAPRTEARRGLTIEMTPPGTCLYKTTFVYCKSMRHSALPLVLSLTLSPAADDLRIKATKGVEDESSCQ